MNDNLRGIVSVLIASTAFVLNDALVKLMSAELPSGEIIIIRGVMATVLLCVGVVASGAMRPLSLLLTPMMLMRLAAAAGSTTCIVLALRHVPLATATTVLQATPLIVTAGAALVYGEKVGWQRWAAAFTGFAGVVLIVRPGGGMIASAGYLILVALFFTTTRDLTTRGIDRAIPSMFVAAASSAAVTLSGIFVVPFDAPWTFPSTWAWGALLGSACCLFVGNTWMITGLRTGEIAVVGPFRYATVPLSLLLGWWWWSHIPDNIAWIGIALVLGAGLYTLWRERSAMKRADPLAVNRSPAE